MTNQKGISCLFIFFIFVLCLFGVQGKCMAQNSVEYTRRSAEKGYADQQFNLALMYYTGDSVAKDYEQAIKWFREAAERRYYKAYLYLGLIYDEEGVQKDTVEAEKWYRKYIESIRPMVESDAYMQYFVETGDADMMRYLLGFFYYEGKGVSKDYAEAAKWYQKAAKQGDIDSQAKLAQLYYNGEGVNKDLSEAFKWFLKAAEQGDIYSQLMLGLMYDEGQGVQKDTIEAEKWYRKNIESIRPLAESGDAKMQNLLGSYYYEGKGVSKDYAEAAKWYQKVAEQGDIDSQAILARLYYKGEGVNKDLSEAFKWFLKAAEQGDIYSQLILGFMYDEGQGVQKDTVEAEKWYRKCIESIRPLAESGDAEMQYSLGSVYYDGKGVSKDYAEAAKWIQKAAEQEDEDALYKLGSMYYLGRGVNKDIAKSEQLFQKLAGNNSAKGYRGLGYYIHYRSGHYDEAIQNFNKAIHLDSNDINSYLRRGLAYIEQKQYQKALNDLNYALKLDDKNSMAWSFRSQYHVETGELSKAVEDINKACEFSDTTNKKAFYNALAGMIFALKKDYAESLKRFENALIVKPDYPLALLGRGHIHLLLGKSHESLEDFKKINNSDFEIDSEGLDFPEIRLFSPAYKSAVKSGITPASSTLNIKSKSIFLKYLKKPVFAMISSVSRMITDTETLLVDMAEMQIVFPYENIKVQETNLKEGQEIKIEGDYRIEGNLCKLNLTITTDFNLENIWLSGGKLPDTNKELLYSPLLRWKHHLVLEIPANMIQDAVSFVFNSKDGRIFNQQVIAKNGRIEMIEDKNNELKKQL